MGSIGEMGEVYTIARTTPTHHEQDLSQRRASVWLRLMKF